MQKNTKVSGEKSIHSRHVVSSLNENVVCFFMINIDAGYACHCVSKKSTLAMHFCPNGERKKIREALTEGPLALAVEASRFALGTRACWLSLCTRIVVARNRICTILRSPWLLRKLVRGMENMKRRLVESSNIETSFRASRRHSERLLQVPCQAGTGCGCGSDPCLLRWAIFRKSDFPAQVQSK